ncbi:hypothetical protein AOLI_G00166580 [Acnodon oligacanthus]
MAERISKGCEFLKMVIKADNERWSERYRTPKLWYVMELYVSSSTAAFFDVMGTFWTLANRFARSFSSLTNEKALVESSAHPSIVTFSGQ